MKAFVTENGVEETCLGYFADAGWQVLYGPDIAPGEPAAARSSYREVLLEERLARAVEFLNPHLPAEAVARVAAKVRRTESTDVLAENWRVHLADYAALGVLLHEHAARELTGDQVTDDPQLAGAKLTDTLVPAPDERVRLATQAYTAPRTRTAAAGPSGRVSTPPPHPRPRPTADRGVC